MYNTPEVWFHNLGIRIHSLPRVAFRIFETELYWYGLIIVIGVAAAIFAAYFSAKRSGQDPDHYLDSAFYLILAGIIGARLYYVIFSWDSYKDNLLSIFAIREGGLAIYGGIIGGFIAALIYNKVKKYNFMLFADTACTSVIIGQIIGRWGNFINKEAYGGFTDSVFAMRYVADEVPYIPMSVLEKSVIIDGITYIQVHPTFLYESLWNLCLLIILILYRPKKKFDGEVLLMYLGGYGFGRFWIEALRTDQLLILGLPVSMIFSAMLVVGSIACVFYQRRKIKNIS